jgi:hypothetical protein
VLTIVLKRERCRLATKFGVAGEVVRRTVDEVRVGEANAKIDVAAGALFVLLW